MAVGTFVHSLLHFPPLFLQVVIECIPWLMLLVGSVENAKLSVIKFLPFKSLKSMGQKGCAAIPHCRIQ